MRVHMKHSPILEGAHARDFLRLVARRTTAVRSFAVALLMLGLVVTSGCGGIGRPGILPHGPLEVTPNTIDFGTVTVGSSSSQTVTVSNSGKTNITVTTISASGTGFTVSGLSAPATLVPGQNIILTAVFKPTSAAQESGKLLVAIDTKGPHTMGSMKGTGSTSLLTVTPSIIGFGNVSVGNPVTQTLRLTNGGSTSVEIKSANANGTGFGISGLTTPQTLTPNESVNFTAEFNPKGAGAQTGTISIETGGKPLAVGLNGMGVSSSAQLVASVSSLSFGNVTIGETPSQQVTLKNTGTASADISNVSLSGSSYTLSGVTSKVVLAPEQSAILTVEFGPKTAGSLPGTVTISSNATNPLLVIQLSGVGAQKGQQQSVGLSWDTSTGQVVGYFVYRSSKPSGPYAKLNPQANPETSYTDNSVANGQMYFYVVTAVDAENIESAFSEQVAVTIPSL